jgi:hypothetical protein
VWERSLQVEVDTVGLLSLRSELSTVDGLRDFILSCLDGEVRGKIDPIVERHELGFNQPTGKVGVLFPEWLADMRVGPNESEPSAGTHLGPLSH